MDILFQVEMNKDMHIGEGRWIGLLFHMRALGTPHKTSLSPNTPLTKQESWSCSELPLGSVGP